MKSFLFPSADSSEPLLRNHSPLLNQLLKRRCFTSAKEAQLFLEPDYDAQLHDPLLLHDIEAACERIESAMQAGETIGVFSDYDCDGIPGAVVLNDFFRAIGYEKVETYIPHRHYEGFGLSPKAIDSLKEKAVSLIITIDCGTSSVAEVSHAKESGIDVIITDHHEPEEILPEAVAIVNPKLGDYPFDGLCGAAVVFKLVQALITRGEYNLTPGWEKWWLDMVGLATIADMVPLRDENRVFARYGLQVLRKSRRPGLQQLLRKNRVNQLYLTEEDIGFTIGPRINAASRMDTPEDAFHMLVETDVTEAGSYVEHLEGLNTKRKTEVALITKDLHKRMKSLEEIPSVIVFGSPDWRPSLVGLAANKLAEEHGRPVFLWGRDGNDVLKGSCRSGGDVSVVELMRAIPEVFLEYGGHHASGGFSVKDEHIHTFADELNTAMQELGDAAKVNEEVKIDVELSLNEVNQLLVADLERLAPFGMGNEKPVFAFRSVRPLSVELFGKTKEHTKLQFETDNGRLEAISFFSTPDSFTHEPKSDVLCTLIAHVEQSFFMGRRQLRLRIVDIIKN